MEKDAPPGGSPSGVEAVVGNRIWGPPTDFEESGSKRGRQLRAQGYLLFVMAAAAMAAAAFTASPGSYDLATGLLSVGALMALVGAWLLYRAARQMTTAVGVYERGVLLPSSFESAPGLATMGGPVFIRGDDIDRVEDMRAGGERAVVVWSRAGRSGIFSARAKGTGLTDAAAGAMLDDLVRAIAAQGWGERAAAAHGEEE